MSDEVPVGIVQDLAEEFDKMCQDRHDAGAEKYGPFKFFGADTLEEAAQELVDLANYARYTFIKLRMIQAQITEKLATEDGVKVSMTYGQGFTPTGSDE